MASLQTGQIKKITWLPLSEIRRPIPPVLDERKIDSMICTLNDLEERNTETTGESVSQDLKNEGIANDDDEGLPPIDIMCVRKNGKSYYFGFGGCHRFQAYERSDQIMVKCKVIPITENMLQLYVGSSLHAMFDE
ncbi:sulfiredoxin [Nadsonia fulvescens var. elongata DSM 6958]|uniref:Sulfiredoxin n=1 Tax=Nadsonia fulvescens var. elongata DSM 6958 TaxID=857566 RepID=A0A1E3PDY2_9ASCO|nr:sulfiredoxin [Nadsonia fulvescens var. elongata DSM 6958]